MKEGNTIAIDFDGVIHKYSKGWQDGSIYDEEIDGALKAIEKFFDLGYNVFILSTRSSRQIKKWIDVKIDARSYNFTTKIVPFWNGVFWNKPRVLGITNRKLAASIYIDDRAYKFKSWDKTLKYIL